MGYADFQFSDFTSDTDDTPISFTLPKWGGLAAGDLLVLVVLIMDPTDPELTFDNEPLDINNSVQVFDSELAGVIKDTEHRIYFGFVDDPGLHPANYQWTADGASSPASWIVGQAVYRNSTSDNIEVGVAVAETEVDGTSAISPAYAPFTTTGSERWIRTYGYQVEPAAAESATITPPAGHTERFEDSEWDLINVRNNLALADAGLAPGPAVWTSGAVGDVNNVGASTLLVQRRVPPDVEVPIGPSGLFHIPHKDWAKG